MSGTSVKGMAHGTPAGTGPQVTALCLDRAGLRRSMPHARAGGTSRVCLVGLLVPGMLTARAGAARMRTKLHRPRHGLQVRVTPFRIPAASEREVCQAIVLDNDEPIDVSMIQFASPTGRTYVSHHFA